MESIIQLDYELLRAINQGLQNPVFDAILPLLRNRFLWMPLYVAVIAYTFVKFPIYKASYYLLFMISMVVFTDLASGQFLKKAIKRERPCQLPVLQEDIEFRVACRRSYSFPSSHATNHFGMAFIFITLLGRNNNLVKIGFLSWAAVISFAQVYVGIHFPLDILGGIILAWLIFRLYLFLILPSLIRLENEASHSKTSIKHEINHR